MTTRTIITQKGKRVEVISSDDLCDPYDAGTRLRAVCHLHGGDHQRSLSINKQSGWGCCFNAACQATVLVAEFNPEVADRLLRRGEQGSQVIPLRSHPQSGIPFQQREGRRPYPSIPQVSTPQPWQQEEWAALVSIDPLMRDALGTCQQALAYLEARGIPLSLAQAQGVGYLPRTVLEMPAYQTQRDLLRRWTKRIIFPLNSPQGTGYIGRSLWHWQPGLDENEHKAMLDQPGTPRRWIKTNPAGWFGYDPAYHPPCLVLVEGGFDRLALLAAGLPPGEVVALVGTAARPQWLASSVQGVVLALDGDEGGNEAMRRLADLLTRAGVQVEVCPPAGDQWGKDWSERWQRIGPQSIWPILEAYRRLQRITSLCCTG